MNFAPSLKKRLGRKRVLPEETENLEGVTLAKFLSKDDIKKAVSRLARQISEDYEGKSPVAVCVLKGARPFFEDLLAQMSLTVDRQFLGVSSYRGETRPGRLLLVRDIECEVKGRDVIIVEDIIDTSKTAEFILRHMESKNPGSLSICALIDKRGKDPAGPGPDYWGFQVDGGFLVGYGMDYMERGRTLEDIYMLRE